MREEHMNNTMHEEQDPDELTMAYLQGVHDGKKQRQWVGLTYEEQEEIVSSAHSLRDAINRTDWKLKEKNT